MLDAYMEEKVKIAIERLKLAAQMSETYYHKPLVITYSGGKDSDTVLSLAEEGGIDFEVVMSITSVEAPQTMIHAHETARRIRGKGKRFTFHYSRDKDGKPLNMHDCVMKKNMMPTRIARFCCQMLKEESTPNRIRALGVRAEESSSREKNYDIFTLLSKDPKNIPKFDFEHAKEVYSDALKVSAELNSAPEEENAFDCQLITASKRGESISVQPILDWKTSDVWEYIRGRGIKYNPIYDMGYHRVGCMLCPMSNKRERERGLSWVGKVLA